MYRYDRFIPSLVPFTVVVIGLLIAGEALRVKEMRVLTNGAPDVWAAADHWASFWTYVIVFGALGVFQTVYAIHLAVCAYHTAPSSHRPSLGLVVYIRLIGLCCVITLIYFIVTFVRKWT